MFKKIGLALLFLLFCQIVSEHVVSHTVVNVSAMTTFSDVKQSYWAQPEITFIVNKGYMSGFGDSTFQPNRLATRAEAVSAIGRSLNISVPKSFKINFLDVPTHHESYDEIRALAYLEVIQNGDYFSPNSPLSRAQISKMLALAYQIEVDSKNKSRFVDYAPSYWAKNYIESLADVGLIKGTTDTKFEPNKSVTRAQLAVFIYRGLQFQQRVKQFETIYDFLSKDYLLTKNDYKAWTAEVISRVNNERTIRNLPALVEDPALTQLAIIKAQDMAQRNYFEHKSPYYGNPWDMASIFDYEYTSFGENIARNFVTPKAVVDAWMQSEAHRENILKRNYTSIGIGITKNVGGNYIWVQQFSSN